MLHARTINYIGKEVKKMAKEKVKKDAAKKEKESGLTVAMIDNAPLSVKASIEDQPIVGTKKEFSSGSVGWNFNGKVVIGGLKCQVSANVIIVGSKNLKN